MFDCSTTVASLGMTKTGVQAHWLEFWLFFQMTLTDGVPWAWRRTCAPGSSTCNPVEKVS